MKSTNNKSCDLSARHFGLRLFPERTVEYTVHVCGFVTLKVLNAYGGHVATLVAEELSAGTYAIRWNAAGVTTGVYSYLLEAGTGGRSEARTLVVK